MADINPNKTGAAPVSEVVQGRGGGKAYQSVAQSAAIAIQEATDHLRNINTISTTATAVALMLLHNQTYEGIQELNKNIDMIKALANNPDFRRIGQYAAEELQMAAKAARSDALRDSEQQ